MTKVFFLLVGIALLYLEFQTTGSGEQYDEFVKAREAGTTQGTIVEFYEREVTERSGGRRNRNTTTRTEQCPTVEHKNAEGVTTTFTEFKDCSEDYKVGDTVDVADPKGGKFGAHIANDTVEDAIKDHDSKNWWMVGLGVLCVLGGLAGFAMSIANLITRRRGQPA